MTVQELRDRLASLDPDAEVMVLDGFNGGGSPRTLNLGPAVRFISQANSDETADCEERVGEKIVVVGFGCY